VTGEPEVWEPTVAALDQAATLLIGGGSVVLPTDTVYGLAALASRPDATARLFDLKDRSERQPMAVLVADVDQALDLVGPPDAAVLTWMRVFWPGPLTLVLPRRAAARGLELGGDSATIGVRCPAHPWVRALAARVGPIATTSANRHGESTPTTAALAAASLVHLPDLVIDDGPSSLAASTVVDTTGPAWRILRLGPVTEDDLRAALVGGGADR